MGQDGAVRPAFIGRVAGLAYLLVIAMSPIAMYIRNSVIVRDDAAASAGNLLAHEALYRAGLAADIASSACYAVVTALFYILFKPVNRNLASVAAIFSTVAIAIGTVGGIFNLAPLTLLNGASHLGGFTAQQLAQLALLSVKLGIQTVNIGIVLFGCYCLSIGWLIVKSTFIPWIFGAGMILAGLGWLTFLYQPLASALAPLNMISGGIGEGGLTLWLLVKSVDATRWHAQVASAV